MKTIDYVKEYFEIFGIPETTGGRYNRSILSLVLYGHRKAGISAAGATKITKKYFPAKPSGVRILTYIVESCDFLLCTKCDEVKNREEFYSNKARKTGKSSRCIPCFKQEKYSTQAEYVARRKAKKLERTPSWANLEKIKAIYNNCPEGFQVDHIIPLQGERVSGLHVEANLQYLTKEENLQKSNHFKVS